MNISDVQLCLFSLTTPRKNHLITKRCICSDVLPKVTLVVHSVITRGVSIDTERVFLLH